MKSKIGAIALILLTAGVCQAQVQYSIRDLGVPTAPDGDAYGGINNSGVVAGSPGASPGWNHVFPLSSDRWMICPNHPLVCDA